MAKHDIFDLATCSWCVGDVDWQRLGEAERILKVIRQLGADTNEAVVGCEFHLAVARRSGVIEITSGNIGIHQGTNDAGESIEALAVLVDLSLEDFNWAQIAQDHCCFVQLELKLMIAAGWNSL